MPNAAPSPNLATKRLRMISKFLARSFLALLVAAPAFGQVASYTVTGTGCTTGRLTTQIGAVPFVAVGVPRLGTTFQIQTEAGTVYPWGTRRSVFLLTGASNTMVSGVPLPIDISVFSPGQPVCGLLQTSGEIVTRLPRISPYTATFTVDLPVPNLTAFAGVRFYQQVLSLETSSFGPPFSAVALSPLGSGVIGF